MHFGHFVTKTLFYREKHQIFSEDIIIKLLKVSEKVTLMCRRPIKSSAEVVALKYGTKTQS